MRGGVRRGSECTALSIFNRRYAEMPPRPHTKATIHRVVAAELCAGLHCVLPCSLRAWRYLRFYLGAAGERGREEEIRTEIDQV